MSHAVVTITGHECPLLIFTSLSPPSSSFLLSPPPSPLSFCLLDLKSRNDFDILLLERLKGVQFSLTNQAQFYFDAVWAAAKALDATAKGTSHSFTHNYPSQNIVLLIRSLEVHYVC